MSRRFPAEVMSSQPAEFFVYRRHQFVNGQFACAQRIFHNVFAATSREGIGSEKSPFRLDAQPGTVVPSREMAILLLMRRSPYEDVSAYAPRQCLCSEAVLVYGADAKNLSRMSKSVTLVRRLIVCIVN